MAKLYACYATEADSGTAEEHRECWCPNNEGGKPHIRQIICVRYKHAGSNQQRA